MALADAALDLGRRGFRVHPLKAKDQPLTAYSRTATSDPAAIAAMWKRWPDALIAIATGDGLVVIDDDRGLDQPDSDMAATLTARTAGRGWHHYYRCAVPVRNSVSKLAPGVDVRGQGGYVVAPPSEGRAWLDPDALILPLPPLVLNVLIRDDRRRSSFEPRTHVPAGERHDYLLRAAGWLVAQEIATSYEDLVAELLAHADQVCEPPESPQSRLKHVKGIARYVVDREYGRR